MQDLIVIPNDPPEVPKPEKTVWLLWFADPHRNGGGWVEHVYSTKKKAQKGLKDHKEELAQLNYEWAITEFEVDADELQP